MIYILQPSYAYCPTNFPAGKYRTESTWETNWWCLSQELGLPELTFLLNIPEMYRTFPASLRFILFLFPVVLQDFSRKWVWRAASIYRWWTQFLSFSLLPWFCIKERTWGKGKEMLSVWIFQSLSWAAGSAGNISMPKFAFLSSRSINLNDEVYLKNEIAAVYWSSKVL